MITQRFYEQVTLLAAIHAVSGTALTSAWVDMAEHERIVALLDVGEMGAGATLDAKLEQATDASGTGAKDITGAAITQLAEADDLSNHTIEVIANDLDLANDFRFVRLNVSASVASLVSALVLGTDPAYKPTTHGFDQAVSV